jgi:hypothetical protein
MDPTGGFVVPGIKGEPAQLGCPCTLKLWEAGGPRPSPSGTSPSLYPVKPLAQMVLPPMNYGALRNAIGRAGKERMEESGVGRL